MIQMFFSEKISNVLQSIEGVVGLWESDATGELKLQFPCKKLGFN